VLSSGTVVRHRQRSGLTTAQLLPGCSALYRSSIPLFIKWVQAAETPKVACDFRSPWRRIRPLNSITMHLIRAWRSRRQTMVGRQDSHAQETSSDRRDVHAWRQLAIVFLRFRQTLLDQYKGSGCSNYETAVIPSPAMWWWLILFKNGSGEIIHLRRFPAPGRPLDLFIP